MEVADENIFYHGKDLSAVEGVEYMTLLKEFLLKEVIDHCQILKGYPRNSENTTST